jgi:hypothetical protein
VSQAASHAKSQARNQAKIQKYAHWQPIPTPMLAAATKSSSAWTIWPVFTYDAITIQKLCSNNRSRYGASFPDSLAWNKICQHMVRGLDLGVEQGRESRQIIETELNWLDQLLAGNRRFLGGERFSRADIAAASLLSPLVLPPQHPTYHNMQLPPGLAADTADWQERPSMRWIRDIYRDYRKLPESGSS